MGDVGTHPTPDTPRDRRAAWLLTLAGQHRHVLEQRLRLNAADVRLVWLLGQRPRTLREIADDLNLEQSTVNRQVNAAIAADLLQRRRVPGQSAAVVEPTASGRRIFEKDMVEGLRAHDVALDELGADADAFLDLLDRFVAAYGDAVHAVQST